MSSTLDLTYSPVAFRGDGKKLRVNSITLLARCGDGYTARRSRPVPSDDAHEFVLREDRMYGDLQVGSRTSLGIDLTGATGLTRSTLDASHHTGNDSCRSSSRDA